MNGDTPQNPFLTPPKKKARTLGSARPKPEKPSLLDRARPAVNAVRGAAGRGARAVAEGAGAVRDRVGRSVRELEEFEGEPDRSTRMADVPERPRSSAVAPPRPRTAFSPGELERAESTFPERSRPRINAERMVSAPRSPVMAADMARAPAVGPADPSAVRTARPAEAQEIGRQAGRFSRALAEFREQPRAVQTAQRVVAGAARAPFAGAPLRVAETLLTSDETKRAGARPLSDIQDLTGERPTGMIDALTSPEGVGTLAAVLPEILVTKGLARAGARAVPAGRFSQALQLVGSTERTTPLRAAARGAVEGLPTDVGFGITDPDMSVAESVALGSGLGAVTELVTASRAAKGGARRAGSRATEGAAAEAPRPTVRTEAPGWQGKRLEELESGEVAELRGYLERRISETEGTPRQQAYREDLAALDAAPRATEAAAKSPVDARIEEIRANPRPENERVADVDARLRREIEAESRRIGDRDPFAPTPEEEALVREAEEFQRREEAGERFSDEYVADLIFRRGDVLMKKLVRLYGFDLETARGVLANAPGPALVRLGEITTREQADDLVRSLPGTRKAGARTSTPAGEAPSFRSGQETVSEFPVRDLELDPERFQFKLNVNKQGVTSELADVGKFDKNLAGIIQVWKDPENGRTYVVNGHHRVNLAKRFGVPDMTVRFINAADAQEARTIGAITNIAEGRGTPIDAAKLFRDSGIGPEDLDEVGVSLKGATARDGLSLSRLPEALFQETAQGKIPWRRAAVIGGSGLDEAAQIDLWKLVQKQEASGKKLTNDEIEELARFAKGAETESFNQETLFGEETFDRSSVLQKAELSAWVKSQLRRERSVFNFVSKSGRARTIEEAGVGKIDVKGAAELAEEAGGLLQVYERLSTRSGGVAEALNRGALELARGGKSDVVRKNTLSLVRDAIAEELEAVGLRQAPGARPGEAAPRGGSREAAAAAPGAEVRSRPGGLESVLPETTPDYSNPQVAEAARRIRREGPITLEEALGRGARGLTVEEPPAAVREVDATEAREFGNQSAREALEAPDVHTFMRAVGRDPQIRAAREYIESQPTTLHTYPVGHPEREPLRERIVEDLYAHGGYRNPAKRPYEGEAARERKIVFVIGPPAAGKSTVADPIVARMRAVLADSDEAKALLPEFAGGKGAWTVQDESTELLNRLLTRSLEEGRNVVVPGTGKTYRNLVRDIELAKQLGYEVHLVINELPPLKAAQRAYRRFLKTGRYVDFNFIINTVGDHPTRNFEMVREHPAVVSWERWSNDVGTHEAPKLLERGGPDQGFREAVVQGRAPVRRGRERAGVPARGRAAAGEAEEGLRALSIRDGVSQALRDAEETVRLYRRIVENGTATPSQVAKYNEARALVRSQNGAGLDAAEVQGRRVEIEAEPRDAHTLDLFGDDQSLVVPRPKPPEPKPQPAVQQESMFGLTPLAQASERLPDAGPFAVGTAEKAPRPTEIVRRLNNALSKALNGLKVAEGRVPRLGGARAATLGVFKEPGRVVRLQDISDVTVFGHEAGHAMQNLLLKIDEPRISNEALRGRLPGSVRGELEDLAQGISDGSLLEGWAELWRRYVDNPESLRARAPEALRWAEERLAEFPAVRNALQEAREEWALYRSASPQARVRAKISTEHKPETMSVADRWSRFRYDVLDDFEPLRRLMEKVRERAPVEGMAEDVETLARLTRGATGAAEHFLGVNRGMIGRALGGAKWAGGTLDFATYGKAGAGLGEILDPVSTNLDNFRDYVVARRALDYHKRGLNPGIRKQDAEWVVAELEKKWGDSFRTAAEGLQTYNRQLLEYLRDAGVISDESLRAIQDANDFYVPFYRVMEGGSGGRLGMGFGHLFSPVKKRAGSGRDIIDPLESIVKNTYLYTQLAARQQVSRAIASLAGKEGVGELLEGLVTPIRPMKLGLGEVEKRLSEVLGDGFDEVIEGVRAEAKREFDELTAGYTPSELRDLQKRGILPESPYDPAEELLMVWRPGDYFRQPNVISVLENGRRKWFEVDPELYRALEGLDREHLDAWVRFLGAPARLLRAGATLAPEFQLRNPARDQVMAYIQSNYGYVPGWDLTRGLFELVRKGEAYEQWKASGGSRSSLLALDRNDMRRQLAQLTKGEGGVEHVLKSPLDVLRAISALMEDGTRMGEFLRARAVEGTTKEGIQRSGAAAREISVDFARHGAKTTALRHLSAFWNARLQGYDRWIREAKTHPARFSAKVFSAITVPSLLEYWVNRDDPEYHRLPQWQRDIFWMFKVGETWVRVPKPFELGLIFGTMPVRVIEWIDQQDPLAFDRFVKESLLPETTSFIPTPTGVMPILENAVNYSFFMERPIVPRGMEHVEARYQSQPSTSEVARAIGERLNVSPLKIDNLLTSWTGGLGRLASQVVDAPTRALQDRPSRAEKPLAERIPGIRGLVASEPGFNSEPIERFYRELERATEAVSTLRFLEKENRTEAWERERQDPQNQRYRDLEPALRKVASEINDLRSQARELERRPDELVSPAEKRERVRELGRRAMELAEQELRRISSRP